MPRPPAEIGPGSDGADVLAGKARVIGCDGSDVTSEFATGAKFAVETAIAQDCTYALLTEASPSCGSSVLYSGNHDGVRRKGFGVTTAALRNAGIKVFSPDQIDALALDCAW